MNNNYAKINPGNFVTLMTKLYSGDFSLQPTKMIWGQPGIGKSQAVKEFAIELENITHKRVDLSIVSLLLMSPIDLRGIPAKDTNSAGELIARWLTPDIFKLDPSEDVINILFLDELSAAPPSVQAAAYQICLDKRIGEHVLPKNTIVIAAGNRVSDKAVAYKMPKPLANRLTHFEMTTDLDSWKDWAYTHNISPDIIGFINWKPNYLNQFNESEDDVAFPTPRSWELANTYLSAGTFKEMFDCIAGTVGLKAAIELKSFITFHSKLPKFKDIIDGKHIDINQSEPGLMYAIISSITSQVISKEEDLTEDNIRNIINFCINFEHEEYCILALKDMILHTKNIKFILPRIDEARTFITKLGKDLFD